MVKLETHAEAISWSLTSLSEEVAAFTTRKADYAPGDLTLNHLEAGLPNRFRHNLASTFRPLNEGNKQLPRQDLCQ